jgi:hypothetical protein
MDVFPKFIIESDDQEGDCLIIAKCTYHKQLATNKDKVKGGGWWSLDYNNKIFTLYGESYDFGEATIYDIISCIKRKKVFTSSALFNNITDEFGFIYRNKYGDLTEIK